MCGIVGFVGEEPAAPILLSGLEKLEYRGYDSAGIAVRNEETGRIEVVKAKGRLKILSEKTDGGLAVDWRCLGRAGSGIPAGRPTGSRLRIMPIPTVRTTGLLCSYITGSSRIIRN